MSKVVCLYHKDCSDGLASAWALSEYFSHQTNLDEVTYIAANYDDALPEGLDGETKLYILDFSYPTDILKLLIRSCKQVIVLDHHPRSKDITKEIEQWLGERQADGEDLSAHMEYCEEKSGALMTWDYFFAPLEAPQILKHVSDYDRWRFDLPKTREIMEALFTYPLILSAWRALFDSHGNGFDVVPFLLKTQPLAEVASRVHDNQVRWAIEHTLRWVDFHGYRVQLVNCAHGVMSKALESVYYGVPFAMAYYDTALGRKFSLRSHPITGMSVREFAQTHGGDGHAHAAGFFVPRNHFLAQI